MTCFILGQVRICDPDAYAHYVNGFHAILAQYGGQVEMYQHHPEELEGEGAFDLAILLRFADRVAAETFWHSPEYRALVRYRHAGARSIVTMIEPET